MKSMSASVTETLESASKRFRSVSALSGDRHACHVVADRELEAGARRHGFERVPSADLALRAAVGLLRARDDRECLQCARPDESQRIEVERSQRQHAVVLEQHRTALGGALDDARVRFDVLRHDACVVARDRASRIAPFARARLPAARSMSASTHAAARERLAEIFRDTLRLGRVARGTLREWIALFLGRADGHDRDEIVYLLGRHLGLFGFLTERKEGPRTCARLLHVHPARDEFGAVGGAPIRGDEPPEAVLIAQRALENFLVAARIDAVDPVVRST